MFGVPTAICVCVFVFRVWLEQRVIEVLLGIPAQRWASETLPKHKNEADSKFCSFQKVFKNLFRVNLAQVVNQDLQWVLIVLPDQLFANLKYDCSYWWHRYGGLFHNRFEATTSCWICKAPAPVSSTGECTNVAFFFWCSMSKKFFVSLLIDQCKWIY